MSLDPVSQRSLDALESRLHRIHYALTGNTDFEDGSIAPSGSDATATARLRNLERRMHSLTAQSSIARDVLQLQSKHPEIFTDTHLATSLPPPALAALVLSHAQQFHRLSGQLTSLQESPVPDPAPLAKLIELQPRIEKAAARQEQQTRELAELRARSAAVVEQWYEVGVLGMGEKWTEWEERMRDVEILVRRMEAAKKRDDGVI